MVNKLTNNVKPLDEVDKINEIIDELDNIDPLPSQTGQSGKFLTTNGTVPSWSEVQSLPSQTGKAGKFLQTDGTDASWESAPFRNIGEIVASTIPLTDAGLHLLDGALIQGGGIYSAFVTYIAGLVSTYPNLFVTESAWQTAVTTYGVCGKFVYDSTNNTVRLPKVTGKVDGTTDVSALGDLAPLMVKLPNITGYFGQLAVRDGNQTVGGAFYFSSHWGKAAHTDNDAYTVSFDASRSSSVYSGDGTDTTIHEQAINVLYYIVIATSTKTDIQVDIDEITTDLNGKVDKSDLSEVQCVVETYVNGTSWYRVWSDKWCEQGGGNITSSGNVNFLKPFKDTNYCLTGSIGHGTNSNTWEHFDMQKSSNSYFYQNCCFDGYKLVSWQACGYIN